MPLKSLGHTIEKQILRPLFRRVRKLTRISGAHDRIAALESRIERLESLFREQAGLHYLRLMGNVVYHIMGHTFFIEDGIEEYNVLDSNVAIKTIPSMNLLNTDQTPAGFWIVSGKNRILNNRAAASRR